MSDSIANYAKYYELDPVYVFKNAPWYLFIAFIGSRNRAIEEQNREAKKQQDAMRRGK